MLLNLAAILSISIGLINLVPVPLLDGGHLMYFAFEAVRGRPMSERGAGIRLPGRSRPGVDADDLRDL